ncbi:S49 family peptidase [Alienimonas sp. DA493]|uniref:S49 family peptidase n=1 Tax=Alienimonas sp. DA493 TaxID=3373605 RepID=UPI00375459CA
MPDAPLIDPSPAVATGIRLDDLFGVWACDDSHLQQRVAYLSSVGLASHVAAFGGLGGSAEPQTVGSVRVLTAEGLMTKRGGSMTAGTTDLRKSVRQAASDDSVSAVVLKIDSPGGTVAGMADLAADVKALAAKKPTVAYVEDMAASGGYWLACACDRIYVNEPLAEVGSIGAYAVLMDVSRAAENAGVKPIVVRSTPLKGAGVPGDRITDEQVAVRQELVDQAHAAFREVVMSARGLTAAEADAVCIGRMWKATEAAALKLHDGVKPLDDVIAELSALSGPLRATSQPTRNREKRMSAATFKEAVAACPGLDKANADDTAFLAAQLDKDATAEAVGAAWCEELQARVGIANEARAAAERRAEEVVAEANELKAAAAKADAEKADADARAQAEADKAAERAKAAGGTDGVPDGPGDGKASTETGDAAAELNEIVAGYEKAGMPRHKAVQKAVKTNPDLHARFRAEGGTFSR